MKGYRKKLNMPLISPHGLIFHSTYFSAAKYVWLLENVPAVREAKEDGRLMIGTVDSWLLYVSRSPSPLS